MAGKKRAGELGLFEKDARRMKPEQEQAEIAAAKAAAASGRFVGKAAALSMKEHEQGYTTRIVSGMDAVHAAQHYMYVLHATVIDGRGHVDDVSSYPTDDELAGVLVPQTARFGDNPALDGALEDEHWAAPQDAHVRDAAANIEAACCQAVHASSFWHRMGFQLAKAATDLMKKVEQRNMPTSIVVGDYIMTYTKP